MDFNKSNPSYYCQLYNSTLQEYEIEKSKCKKQIEIRTKLSNKTEIARKELISVTSDQEIFKLTREFKLSNKKNVELKKLRDNNNKQLKIILENIEKRKKEIDYTTKKLESINSEIESILEINKQKVFQITELKKEYLKTQKYDYFKKPILDIAKCNLDILKFIDRAIEEKKMNEMIIKEYSNKKRQNKMDFVKAFYNIIAENDFEEYEKLAKSINAENFKFKQENVNNSGRSLVNFFAKTFCEEKIRIMKGKIEYLKLKKSAKEIGWKKNKASFENEAILMKTAKNNLIKILNSIEENLASTQIIQICENIEKIKCILNEKKQLLKLKNRECENNRTF